MIEQANNLAEIGKGEFDTEDQRLETIGNAFEKMAQYNYAVLVNSIRYIKIPDSDVVVEDYDQIVEFIDNVESKIGKEIDEAKQVELITALTKYKKHVVKIVILSLRYR